MPVTLPSDVTAEEIAEDLLYHTNCAPGTKDFGKIAKCFALPQYTETVLGSRLIETEDAVIQVLKRIQKYFEDNGVVDLVRTVVSAEFIDADTIGSTHVSRLLKAEGELFRAPYPVYSIIRREGRDWKIASGSYAILDAPDHNKALQPDPSFSETAEFDDL